MRHSHSHTNTLADVIERLTGQHPASCYQCGKCSAGCPVREHTDSAPNRVVRLVQLGFEEQALRSHMIWLCAGCQTCTDRCPQEFDLARFMDAMREAAAQRGIAPAERETAIFHTAFLNQIRNHGRAYELGLIMEYKLGTWQLLKDVDAAPTMLLKRKMGLLPHNVKGRDHVRRIFERTSEFDRRSAHGEDSH